MFDDYDYKHIDTRIKFRFVQQRDEPMFPWEIAKFLTDLNTVYYKYELLNSVCSALNNGIEATDIYIFDQSLPLYKSYTSMNLLSETTAAAYGYYVGLPYPLLPSSSVYNQQLLYKYFKRINSYLYRCRVRPLYVKSIAAAYEVLLDEGIDEAEKYVAKLATRQANIKSKRKNKFSIEGLKKVTERYIKDKAVLLSDLDELKSIGVDGYEDLLSGSEKKNLQKYLNDFFRLFNKTSRPLIYVKLKDGNVRVLGRSLINKGEKSGLELQEIVRNSPLGAFLEGSVAAIQAIQDEKRKREMHELEKEKIKLEHSLLKQQISNAKYDELIKKIEVEERLARIASETDITAINNLPDNYTRRRLVDAYRVEDSHRNTLLLRQGLELDESSTEVIDVEA